MKKVAGTLKVDQAQYRELEAFSKFGSDLDPTTLAVLDKGSKNVEILKQNLFSPMKVEEQVAIIYCGTKGLLKSVPVHKVRDFENDYLAFLRSNHADVLKTIAGGVIDNAVTAVLDAAAADIAGRYSTR
jgi:F-type H+-transporting ATPase subunit alpha